MGLSTNSTLSGRYFLKKVLLNRRCSSSEMLRKLLAVAWKKGENKNAYVFQRGMTGGQKC